MHTVQGVFKTQACEGALETTPKTAAGYLASVLAAAVASRFLIDANTFRPELEEKLTQAVGRKADLGYLKLSLFPSGVSATRLGIADDPTFSRLASFARNPCN
jgi:uncharacterized protein involved in outer membrane biogenesis